MTAIAPPRPRILPYRLLRPRPQVDRPTANWIRWAALVGLALVLTLANAAKAVHIDDAAYLAYAAHIAEQPLSPYGSEICWDNQMHAPNHLLAPPVMLYWLAAAVRVFGDDPVLCKLSLLPLHLILVLCLFALLRRFAGPAAMPLAWMTALSPALLPSTNLMLDVPALALGLAAVVVFFRACDHESSALALAAGLIAGLAMETKYTGFVVPGVLLAYGLTHGRLRLAVVAAGVAVVLFVAWEILVAWQQGQSHFLLALGGRPGSTLSRVRHLVLALATMTAGLGPGAGLAALLALTRSWRWVILGVTCLGVGVLLIGVVPAAQTVWLRDAANGQTRLGLESLLYGALAAVWWLMLVLVSRRLAVQAEGSQNRRVVVFLLLWLGLEIAGYFALSPFTAARRVLGLGVVATFLIGRLASRVTAGRNGPLWVAAGVSAAAGLFLAWVDVRQAAAPEQAAARVAELIADHHGEQRAWFVGSWGFQYYAMRTGLRPLIPGKTPLKRGDFLALAEQPIKRVDLRPDTAPLEKLQVIVMEDAVPWQTVGCFYAGRTPVQHCEGPRIRVTLYRVTQDFMPIGQGEFPGLR